MSALTLAQQEALYTAITEGDTEATAVLLKQCEADINGRPFAGLTADMAGPESTCLHLAACYAKPGVVESLLSQAADPTATADGATPAEALAAAEEARMVVPCPPLQSLVHDPAWQCSYCGWSPQCQGSYIAINARCAALGVVLVRAAPLGGIWIDRYH